MNQQRTVIGAHAFFFPEGQAFTSPSAGTASRIAKPDAAETTWFDTGVADWKIKPEHKVEEFKAPSPGLRSLWDLIQTEAGLTLTGKWMQMSNLTFRMLLGTASTMPLTGAGGQYAPMGGDSVVRGWLQLQQYNAKNQLINTLEVYVGMRIPGEIAFDDKLVDVDVEAKVLFSTLNTGTLT